MAHIHFFLNPKGGTGKSLTATIVAQYLRSQGKALTCIDCDPVTPTLVAYAALKVIRLDVMEENNIEKSKFDELMNYIVAGEDDEHFVIDNGTSSFVALADYMVTNEVVSLLKSLGHTITFHAIIVGGDNLDGTIDGFIELVKSFSEHARIVVWLNPFFGAVEHQGKTFEDFVCFHDHMEQIAAVIHYPNFPKDTFGKSFAMLQKDRLLFDEVVTVPQAPKGYDLMTVHRLGMMQKNIYSMLDAARIL